MIDIKDLKSAKGIIKIVLLKTTQKFNCKILLISFCKKWLLFLWHGVVAHMANKPIRTLKLHFQDPGFNSPV